MVDETQMPVPANDARAWNEHAAGPFEGLHAHFTAIIATLTAHIQRLEAQIQQFITAHQPNQTVRPADLPGAPVVPPLSMEPHQTAELAAAAVPVPESERGPGKPARSGEQPPNTGPIPSAPRETRQPVEEHTPVEGPKKK